MSNLNLQLSSSSVIESAEFEEGTLVVTLKNSRVYGYENVPSELVKQWEKAPSAGSFFTKHIRDRFTATKLS